ncbi:MAG: AAA family ATPase [Polyangiaceae bacterium]|nr:AAA family ATPase [Polyangiaceae bacterium]
MKKSAEARWLAPAFAMLAVLAAPSLASAQDASFYVDRLRIGGAPEDGIGIWRPEMGPKSRLFGQLGIGFALRPFRVENYVDTSDQGPIVEQQNGPPVSSQLITYMTAGAEIADRFAIQVSFPLAFQSTNSTVNIDAQITRQAIDQKTVVPMDLRLDARLILFRTESRSFKLGLEGAVFLPTGNEFSWGGDQGVSGHVGIGAEYDAKAFAVVMNAGYQIRPAAELNQFKLNDELTYGVGAFVPLADGRFRVGGEVFGSFGLLDETAGDVDNVPLEWMAEGRMNLGEDPRQLYVGLGGGTRITAGYAPDFRAVGVVGGWFPLEDWDVKNDKGFRYKIPADSDGDKLADDIDMCPMDKEDHKGSNTDDGCPELLNDADSDGVPDVEDACPKEPGPRNPDPAKNGCPEFIRRMNPWWEGKPGRVLPDFRRWAFAKAQNGLLRGVAPITVIRGPRQIGKSTIQDQIIEHLLYREGVNPKRILKVQYDDLRPLGRLDLPVLDIAWWYENRILGQTFNEAARSNRPAFLFLDEVQNLQNWAPELKSLVDQSTVRVLVTGSSALRIESGRDSLAGRISTVELGPLLLREVAALGLRADLPPFLADNGLDRLTDKGAWVSLAAHGTHLASRTDCNDSKICWSCPRLCTSSRTSRWETDRFASARDFITEWSRSDPMEGSAAGRISMIWAWRLSTP